MTLDQQREIGTAARQLSDVLLSDGKVDDMKIINGLKVIIDLSLPHFGLPVLQSRPLVDDFWK